MLPELRALAREALLLTAPPAKCAAVARLQAASIARELALDPGALLTAPLEPGRPALPRLVHPARVPRRGLGTPRGRMALLHALAHIEFNAINLALDLMVRFAGMPEAFYTDWLGVAADEARHHRLLVERLAALGGTYGELPAHDGLWEAAAKTRGDLLARLGLVPRMLEARGLDVTPALQARLRRVQDDDSAALLELILHDEVCHVAVGNRWYETLCRQRGMSPAEAFIGLCAAYGVRTPQPPFNLEARRRAGFSQAELDDLSARAVSS